MRMAERSTSAAILSAVFGKYQSAANNKLNSMAPVNRKYRTSGIAVHSGLGRTPASCAGREREKPAIVPRRPRHLEIGACNRIVKNTIAVRRRWSHGEGRPRRQLPGCPPVVAPVATAFMLAEGVSFARTPTPGVFMDGHPGLRRIGVGFVGMPADIAGTYDGGRCAGGRKCQQGSAGKGGFGQNSHGVSLLLPCSLPACQRATSSDVPAHREKQDEFQRQKIGVILASGSDGAVWPTW